MPSVQSRWTFNAAFAIAISSASVLAGLLMRRLPPERSSLILCGQVAGSEAVCRGDNAPLSRDVLGEDPHHVALDGRRRIEHVGGDALDRVAQRRDLRLPCKAFSSLDAGQFIHRSVADLAFD